MQRDKDHPTTQEIAEMAELEEMIRDKDRKDRIKRGDVAAKRKTDDPEGE